MQKRQKKKKPVYARTLSSGTSAGPLFPEYHHVGTSYGRHSSLFHVADVTVTLSQPSRDLKLGCLRSERAGLPVQEKREFGEGAEEQTMQKPTKLIACS